jgi:hypothetical protein
MQSKEKTAFEKFVDAFVLRYLREFQYLGLPEEETFCFIKEEMLPEEEMLRLFVEFKGLGKTSEQWFEEQELS